MATRTPLIAGNWKMNLTHLEGIALVQKISFTLPEKYLKHVDVAVFPPFTALRSVQTLIEADKIKFKYGAQDISAHDSGAYTGEISGIQLAKLGCTYVLVGHSERREYHLEADELLAKKVNAAYKHGLIPMLCVGEGLEVREAGNQVEHSVNQLLAGMADLTPEQAGSIVLAYEPVWAIGTGRVATPADAQEVCGPAGGPGREVRPGDRGPDPHLVRRVGQVGQRRGDLRADRRGRSAGGRRFVGRDRVRHAGRERGRGSALTARVRLGGPPAHPHARQS